MTGEAGVTMDVTTLIAQEYITSRNSSRTPRDPFARDCFVATVQTLIFNTNVYVMHPVLTDPRAVDFGTQPHLLRSLFARHLIRPLRLTAALARDSEAAQAEILRVLESDGAKILIEYIEHTRMCDSTPGTTTIADRIRSWSDLQARAVRNQPEHHRIRIPTADGIENDDLGSWTGATAASLRGRLRLISPAGQEADVLAFLTRGLKYQARTGAEASGYQAHPGRRDFIVSFEFTAADTRSEDVLDIIKMIRGIHDTLLLSADEHLKSRALLLEFELPLLGGRLWNNDETGKYTDTDWIEYVVDRIADYRSRSAELRSALAGCLVDEDRARLARDVEDVKFHLLERLGLRDVQPSPVERDLLAAASVVEAAAGLPKVSGIWLAPRKIGKRMTFRGNPYQQFLYREFIDAWKRTGR